MIFTTVVGSACSSPGMIQEPELNRLQLKIEAPESADGLYTMHISGFDGLDNPGDKPKAVVRLLNRHEWEDILFIQRTGDETDTQLLVAVKNSPESLNRVLWLLGKEQYRSHSVDMPVSTENGNWAIISSMPEPVGGPDGLQEKVNYPAELAGSGIEGQVVLQFIVNEYGEAENPEIISSLHPAADREALRVIRQASFTPGMQNGLPVRVLTEISLDFIE